MYRKSRYGMSERRIVLIGKTGEGKSAVGNTLLRQTKFHSAISATSITKETHFETILLYDKQIRIIDTPGFFDNRNSDETSTKWLEKEILKCLVCSLPGPHACLFVMRPDRLTEEDIKTNEQLLRLFGARIYEHVILIFTHAKDLDSENMTLEEYLCTLPPYFQDFYNKCGKRALGVDNKYGTTDDKRRFMEELLRMPVMVNNEYYTNHVVEEATKVFFDRVQQVQTENSINYDDAVQEVLKEAENGAGIIRYIKTGGVGVVAAIIAGGICSIFGLPIAIAAVPVGAGSAVAYHNCSIL